MYWIITFALGFMGRQLLFKLTGNEKIATSTTALITYLLINDKAEVKAATEINKTVKTRKSKEITGKEIINSKNVEIKSTKSPIIAMENVEQSEHLLSEKQQTVGKLNEFVVDTKDSIFIQYPGLKVWTPKALIGKVKSLTIKSDDKMLDIKELVDKTEN